MHAVDLLHERGADALVRPRNAIGRLRRQALIAVMKVTDHGECDNLGRAAHRRAWVGTILV